MVNSSEIFFSFFLCSSCSEQEMDVMKNYFVEVRYGYQVLLGDWLNCDQIVIREQGEYC